MKNLNFCASLLFFVYLQNVCFINYLSIYLLFINSVPFVSNSFGHVQKQVALHDIAKIKKSQIFVLFENEVSYEDLFCPQVFYNVRLCVTFSAKI